MLLRNATLRCAWSDKYILEVFLRFLQTNIDNIVNDKTTFLSVDLYFSLYFCAKAMQTRGFC